MTDHRSLKMNFEDRRIINPDIIEKLLSLSFTATLALHDEPYPYIIPIHYGYKREGNDFILYFHTAKNGHKLKLINKNPNASFNLYTYLNRAGYKKYKNELQDYRSVSFMGKLEMIKEDEADEMFYALNSIQKGGKRPLFKHLPEDVFDRLIMFRMKADIFTAKSNYPITDISEAVFPPLEEL